MPELALSPSPPHRGARWPALSGWQNGTANRYKKQGTISDTPQAGKGEIFRAEEVGKKVYDALKASTDTANLYKYFTTKGQSPSIIKNPKERQMAIDAKKMIEDVGKALVKAKATEAIHTGCDGGISAKSLPEAFTERG